MRLGSDRECPPGDDQSLAHCRSHPPGLDGRRMAREDNLATACNPRNTINADLMLESLWRIFTCNVRETLGRRGSTRSG